MRFQRARFKSVSVMRGLFVIPFLMLWTFAYSQKATANEIDIYLSLLKVSEVEIQEKNNHCELKDRPLTVAKFLARRFEYVNSSPKGLSLGFDCIVEDRNKICSLSYGQKAKTFSNEGWDRILKFEYNLDNKTVNLERLICIDVP